MLIYRVLVPLFCLFMIASSVSSYRRQQKTGRELLFWIIFWSVAVFLSYNPHVLTALARQIGFETGSNALFVLFFLILFYLVFRSVVAIESLETQLTELVRKNSLKNLDHR